MECFYSAYCHFIWFSFSWHFAHSKFYSPILGAGFFSAEVATLWATRTDFSPVYYARVALYSGDIWSAA